MNHPSFNYVPYQMRYAMNIAAIQAALEAVKSPVPNALGGEKPSNCWKRSDGLHIGLEIPDSPSPHRRRHRQ